MAESVKTEVAADLSQLTLRLLAFTLKLVMILKLKNVKGTR